MPDRYAFRDRQPKFKEQTFKEAYAIDIGTSGIAVSRAVGDKQSQPFIDWVGLDRNHNKIPTVALYDLKKDKVIAIGEEAEKRYNNMKMFSDGIAFALFSEPKKQMYRNEIGGDSWLFGLTGTEAKCKKKVMVEYSFRVEVIAAVKVIAGIVSYIVERVKTVYSFRDLRNVRWVLTIPARWRLETRRFMLQAARLASLDENNVLIVNEAIAAGIHYLSDRNLEGTNFVVFDIGAGTTDCTGLTIEDLSKGTFREIMQYFLQSEGIDVGSCDIDDAIEKEIESMVRCVLFEYYNGESALAILVLDCPQINPGKYEGLKTEHPQIYSSLRSLIKSVKEWYCGEDPFECLNIDREFAKEINMDALEGRTDVELRKNKDETACLLLYPKFFEKVFEPTFKKLVDFFKKKRNDFRRMSSRKHSIKFLVTASAGRFNGSSSIWNGSSDNLDPNNIWIKSFDDREVSYHCIVSKGEDCRTDQWKPIIRSNADRCYEIKEELYTDDGSPPTRFDDDVYEEDDHGQLPKPGGPGFQYDDVMLRRKNGALKLKIRDTGYKKRKLRHFADCLLTWGTEGEMTSYKAPGEADINFYVNFSGDLIKFRGYDRKQNIQWGSRFVTYSQDEDNDGEAASSSSRRNHRRRKRRKSKKENSKKEIRKRKRKA
eukprot:jgi/Bigna1/84647/fgenesh1_pg.190_\